MIPVKLSLQGFLSYLEPVEIDFSSVSVACISGANGAGKSTLLDAITWALFGEARRKDDAIIHQRAETAKVTLEFEYEGNLYRIMRLRTKGKTGQVELHLAVGDGTWKVLTEARSSDTNQRIVDILKLDYETFINASFFQQGNADSFTQKNPTERKRILSTILGLDIWEQYKDAALARRRDEENQLTNLDERVRQIDEQLAGEAQLKDDLATAEQREKDLKKTAEALQKLRSELESKQARWQERERQISSQRQDLSTRRQRMLTRQERQHALQQERSDLIAVLANADAVEAAYQQWLRDRDALNALDKLAASYHAVELRCHAPRQAIEVERRGLMTQRDALLHKRDEMAQVETGLTSLRAEITRLATRVQEGDEKLSQREVLQSQLQAWREERGRLESERVRFKGEGEALTERINGLENASGAECPLCGQPLGEDDRVRLVSELTAQREQMRDSFRQIDAQFKTLSQQIDQTENQLNGLIQLDRTQQTQREQLSAKQERLRVDEKNVEVWKTGDAVRLQELETLLAAEDFAREARAQLAEVESELAALGYDAAAHERLRQAEQNGRQSEAQRRQIGEAGSKLQPIEKELETLTAELVEEQQTLDGIEANLRKQETDLASERGSTASLDEARQQYFAANESAHQASELVGTRRNQLEELRRLRKLRVTLIDERTVHAQQIDQYKTLEKAFGKDGVPALLIEQALPAIEEEANSILDRLSSGMMSLRINTQGAYKDKNRTDVKETLDILINDPSGTREYAMFSGGEAFRINFALRLALSRVLAKRAGARLQTLVIDEGFGSQDAEGRQRLVEAINQVKDDFAKILVITHMEELKDQFPARIEVSKTASGSRVEVISG
jgi:exonuclease SbcC